MSRYDNEEEERWGGGGGREEVERGREVKKEGGKKEGVNIFNAFQKKCFF